MTSRYGATRDDIASAIDTLGQPRYRVDQVHNGMWQQRLPIESLTSLPKALRAALEAEFPLALTPILERRSSDEHTTKWLWQAAGGDQIETVLMRSPNRATVCVSSQAGCAMGCTFCATGQAGFDRHLDVGEIVEQVLRAQHATEARVSNVVFMGMGEPLANLDAVEPAIERLHRDLGLSARKITVSTVGVVPGIERLREFPLPVTLAVSLHAPDDALRDSLVPLNRRYPISDVLDAARAYVEAKGRRVTFEYACIEGTNDHLHLADALAGRLGGFPGGAHVNLIPLNSTAAFGGTASAGARLGEFAERLTSRGITATVRRNRGADIDAACGQLRMRAANVPAVRESSP